MPHTAKTKHHANEKERNLFMSFLEEYNRKPAVDVVLVKRERFSRLHRIVVKSIFLSNFEKCWHVVSYMPDLLEADEYKDENVNAPIEEVMVYLDIILALCAFKAQVDLENCVEFCNSLIKICGHVYPMLYGILAGCYMKLRCKDQASEIITSGLDFIIDNYAAIETMKQKLKLEQEFFTARNLGENSAKYNLFVLYAYAKHLKLEVDDKVGLFCKANNLEVEYEDLKILLLTPIFDCCFGSQVNDALDYQRTSISMNDEPTVRPYSLSLKIADYRCCRVEHVPTHCTLLPVMLNSGRMNGMIYVKSFKEVPCVFDEFLDFECCHKHELEFEKPRKLSYANAMRALAKNIKRVKRRRLALKIGKPGKHLYPMMKCECKVEKMFRKTVSPLLKQFSKHVRVEGEIAVLYLQCLNADNHANRLYESMDHTNLHLMSIKNQYDLEITGRSPKKINTYVKEQVETIIRSLAQWLGYAQQCVGYVHFQCFPDEYREGSHALREFINAMNQDYYTQNHKHNSTSNACRDCTQSCGGQCYCEYFDRLQPQSWRNSVDSSIDYYSRPTAMSSSGTHAVKETQTNYSKFSCRAKQTQTDKYTPDEQNLWKQINLLEANLTIKAAKVVELEGKVFDLHEAKREYAENQSKTIKGLKRELSQAKRTILEKNKDLNQQKNQIEQLQNNLSKLNKPYSHVVKPPEDMPKAICSKILTKENEKLQVLNANILAENSNLQKQLDEMTEEFDRMKARRDALVEANEEVTIMYKEKSDQYDELYDRIKSLKDENSAKLKNEQDKLSELKQIILYGVREFIDLLINKMAQYKMRCERIQEELTCYFYSCTANMNIKQMCETNQRFLVSIVRQLDRNVQILIVTKDSFGLPEERLEGLPIQNSVIALNWNDLIIYTDEFCTALFNQYVHVLNALMPIQAALSNALVENARLINMSMSAQQAMMDPERFYRPHYNQRNYNTLPKMPLQSSNLGPIGSNRPSPSSSSSSMSNYQRMSITPPSPDIDDPSTKNILSQIAHAVNYPQNLTLGNAGYNQGVVRRPVTNCSYANASAGANISASASVSASANPNHSPSLSPNPSSSSGQYRQRNTPSAMKENYGWNQYAHAYSMSGGNNTNTPGTSSEHAHAFSGKYRDIYLAVKRRFPTALMTDLINALNFLKAMNINLHKYSIENIYENVGNYIDHQMQLRLKSCEPQLPEQKPAKAMATDEYCSICFEKLTLMPSSTLKCMHIFHEKCIGMWLRQNNVCPICRKFTILE